MIPRWTKDHLIDIANMLDGGASLQNIATKYSEIKGERVSRNAVAGIIARSGLKGRSRLSCADGFRSQKAVVRKEVPKMRRTIRAWRPMQPTPVPPIEQPVSFPHACDFVEMDFLHRCNWIIQDHPRLYCGNPKPNSRKHPYCVWHHHVGTTLPRR
jgi:hypothetical protein